MKHKWENYKFRAKNVLTGNWEYYTFRDLVDGKAMGIALDDWSENTGLISKDGQNIYEGDILHWPNEDNSRYNVMMIMGEYQGKRVDKKLDWNLVAKYFYECSIIDKVNY